MSQCQHPGYLGNSTPRHQISIYIFLYYDQLKSTDIPTYLTWSGENHMKINFSKTKEMLVSFSRPPPDIASITIDGCPLERVESVTLLGVKISNDLTWDLHIAHKIMKVHG